MESLILDVTPFQGRLYAAIASESLPVSTRPIDSVLVPIVDPKLVVFENEDHAPGSMRWEVEYS